MKLYLSLALLLMVGCAGEPGAAKPRRDDVFVYGDEAHFGSAAVRLIKVRRCDYVMMRAGSYDGGNFMLHAADCENPAHAAGLKAEKP